MTQKMLDGTIAELETEFKSVQGIVRVGYYVSKIIDVKKTNSHLFYKSEEYNLRVGLKVTIENGQTFFLAIPDRLIGSQMAKFMMVYGKAPRKGMPIRIDIQGDFDRIKLD